MDDSICKKVPSSFRDPSGSLFYKNGTLYRTINNIYKDDYDLLISFGLYDKLSKENLLVSHEETDASCPEDNDIYKIIRPDVIPFISYPYEWCFSQLKDAALAMLKIQMTALEYGMSLKDASAYNIQFNGTSPILIDTLSFERYHEGMPWIAYRQFCQHFFAPLGLMSMKDMRLGQLSRIYIDGIPLDLASKILGLKTILNPSCLLHIHMHAGFQGHFSDKPVNKKACSINKKALMALIDSLLSDISGMKLRPAKTEWTGYYDATNYKQGSLEHKERIIGRFIEEAGEGTVWDLGTNTGLFSRISASKGRRTISLDNDPHCIESLYGQCVNDGEKLILPLVIDLTNPPGAIGWKNTERSSFIGRGPAKTALALALIHHLAIANNVPLRNIAEFFTDICEYLIIEFIPKEDSQVQRLLASREDIFPNYTKSCFESEFSRSFEIKTSEIIAGSRRTIYFMKRKQPK